MDRVRIAVLGMNHGYKFASDALSANGIELVAVADTTEGGQQRAGTLGVPCYDDYRKLLDECELEGVIVTLPNRLHREAVERCASRRYHVLVEKPIADTVIDATAMIDACRRAQVKLLVGHHRRFSSKIKQAKSLIASGRIGRLVGGNLVWVLAKDKPYFDVPWRVDEGGGPLLVNAIHDVDNLRFLTGCDISRVYAVMRTMIRQNPVEDSASIVMETVQGPTFTYYVSDGVPSPWSYEFNLRENPRYVEYAKECYQFFGTEGSMAFPSMTLYSYNDKRYGWEYPLEEEQHTVARNDPMTEELLHFADVIREKCSLMTSGEDGLETLKVILAIKKSGSIGEPVRVADVMEGA